jgi:hypothetical protein
MCSCGRVRAAEDAPRDPFRLLERRHGLAQIVERGIVVLEGDVLVTQTNLANSYDMVGRFDEALSMRRDVYSGRLKLDGEEHNKTVVAANNYAISLTTLQRFEETRSLLLKTMPVARRALGEGHRLTLKMHWVYAETLYLNPAASLDDVREAVTTLEETTRTARRVLGSAHPTTWAIEDALRKSRAALRAREAASSA